MTDLTQEQSLELMAALDQLKSQLLQTMQQADKSSGGVEFYAHGCLQS